MKFNIISYILFLFVMFVPAMIFAPWSTDSPPNKPEPGSNPLFSCDGWIHFSGFKLDDYTENRELTMERDYALDKDASTWAAIYAFEIGGARELEQFTPEEFCLQFGETENNLYPFKALKQETRTCVGWITIYGFREFDIFYNVTLAQNQELFHMFEVSIWAYMYYRYMKLYGPRHPISPSRYCFMIGMNVDNDTTEMSFISDSGPYLTCEAWIKLHDYTDDVASNINKAVIYSFGDWEHAMRIHYLPRKYAIFIVRLKRDASIRVNMTPLNYCRRILNIRDTETFKFEILEDGDELSLQLL